jgi:hypothetical protein
MVDATMIGCLGRLHLRNTKEIGKIIYGWIAGSLSSTNNQLPAAGFATCFLHVKSLHVVRLFREVLMQYSVGSGKMRSAEVRVWIRVRLSYILRTCYSQDRPARSQ